MANQFFEISVEPNWRGLLDCLNRKGTPERTYFFELMLDPEVQAELSSRFHLVDDLDPDDPYFSEQMILRLQRFLGYDFVRQGVERLDMPFQGFA